METKTSYKHLQNGNRLSTIENTTNCNTPQVFQFNIGSRKPLRRLPVEDDREPRWHVGTRWF